MSSGTKVSLGALLVLAIALVAYYTLVVSNQPEPALDGVADASGNQLSDESYQPGPTLDGTPAPAEPVAAVIPEPEPKAEDQPAFTLDLEDLRLTSGDQMIIDTPKGQDPPTTQPGDIAAVDTGDPAVTPLESQPGVAIDVPTEEPDETPLIAVEPDTIVMGQTPDEAEPETYTVQEGESLWTIAKKKLGAGAKWELIAKANPDVDPDRVKAGMKLIIPRPVAERGPISEKTPTDPLGLGFDDETKTIIVGENEGLWDIAAREYGDGTKWRLIYTANKDVIKNPNVIRSGMKLKVPPLPRD